MAITKEISCVVGTYTNKDGQQKNRYQRIGSIINTKNGELLKIDVIPLVEGGWAGWAYLNDPQPKENKGFFKDDFPKDDDIPFN